MGDKYIEIKQESCNRTQDLREALAEIVSYDIIFVLSYPDMLHDHASESMGQFCEVAYSQGNKVVWQTFNPEAIKPVNDFIAQLGDKVLPIVKRGTFAAYIGKPREEFHIDQHDLIYQGKYRFEGDRYMLNFDSIFENTEGN